MKPISDLSSLMADRQTAAELLALAVIQLFPKTLLLQGEGTETLFFYDFAFSEPLLPEALLLIEERMRQLIYKKVYWEAKEMVAKNAAMLFEHSRQPLLAAQLEGGGSLVKVVRAEGFADLCEKEMTLEWKTSPYFKLVESFPIKIEDTEVTRIIGLFSFNREDLKKRVKEIPSMALRNHQRWFELNKFFMPVAALGEGIWTWLPPANVFRARWQAWWERECSQRKIQITCTPSERAAEKGDDPTFCWRIAHRDYWKMQASDNDCRLAELGYLYGAGEGRAKNGFFEPLAWIGDRVHLFLSDEKVVLECISSLQFIMEIPKILGFEFRVVLHTSCRGTQKTPSRKGKAYCDLLQVLEQVGLPYQVLQGSQWEMESRIQFQILDSLGRWWDGPFLAIDPAFELRKGFTFVVFSVFNSMERLLALCVEQGRDIK